MDMENTKIEVVIYIYICLCLCMIAFNCLVIVYHKYGKLFFSKDLWKLEKRIQKQMEYIKNKEPVDAKNQAYLTKKLVRFSYLQIFHKTIEPYLEQKDTSVVAYLSQCHSLFGYLALKYEKKSEVQKAYLAYILSQYGIHNGGEEESILDSMIVFTTSESIYCRQNALQVLYLAGDAKRILQAMKSMQKNGILHNQKLITDGLLTFKGKEEELAALLWDHFYEFDLHLQVSIINYIKAIKVDYCESFYALLIDEKTHKEIKLALMRYFGRHPYEPAKEVLLNTLKPTENQDWEYRAISAMSIGTYPSPEVIDILKYALSDENWFVRYNASDSLLAMGVEYLDLVDISNGTDRYAREMLEYKTEIMQLEEKKKGSEKE